MEYVCVEARFLFYNGKKRYTVEYCYGLAKWFVFNEDETSGAIHSKEDKKIKLSSVNNFNAEGILIEFLNSQK